MKIDLNNYGNYKIPDNIKNGFCVDIGANVGNFFKKYQNFFSLIHYYEPYLPCYKICNNFNYNNVFGYNEAVADKDGKTFITNHSNNHCGSNAIVDAPINNDWTKNNIQEIKTVSLETVMERINNQIDYLKCDAETSEYLIFLNKDISKIKYIGLELHWQMGEEKYNNLLNHILITHDSRDDLGYTSDVNKECLFFNKQEKYV